MRASWLAAAACACALLLPDAVRAQGSPYVPLDDVAYVHLDALLSRGLLPALPALERPWTVREVLAALDDSTAAAAYDSPLLAALRRTARRAVLKHAANTSAAVFAPAPAPDPLPGEGAGMASSIALSPFAVARTTAAPELTRPGAGGERGEGVFPGAAVRLTMEGGPIAVAGRVRVDPALRRDPAFRGRTDRLVAARVEDGYVVGHWRHGSLFAGRTARSWGPPGLPGLAVGNAPLTYDHLYGRVGGRRLRLSSVVAALDADTLSPDSVARRHFAAHRLAARFGSLELALGEAVVYGGVNRGVEPSFLNPLNGFNLAQYAETFDGNVSYTLDVHWRTRRGAFAAQGMLDDVQVDDCETACDEPASYGLSLSAEGLPLLGPHRWFASYTRVSNLAYRAALSFERYAVRGVGLARSSSDYDEARLGIDALAPGGTPLRLYAALRRQGAGDYRLPYPAPADYATTPGFLAGTVERVARAGVSWAALAGPLELQGDVGVNRARNAGGVAGRGATDLEGRLRVSLEAAALRWLVER